MYTIDDIWQNMQQGDTIAQSFTLDDHNKTFLVNKHRKASPVLGAAKFIWYMSGAEDTKMIFAYTEKSCIRNDYFMRPTPNINLLNVYKELLELEPNTKHAVISFKDALDPCLKNTTTPRILTRQLILCDNKLHMVCTTRSADLWYDIPYDIYVNTLIQRLMAQVLNIGVGSYTHQIGILHKINNKAHDDRISLMGHYWQDTGDPFSEVPLLVELEKQVRQEQVVQPSSFYWQIKNTLLRDQLLLCASRWVKINLKLITSMLLQETLDAYYRG